MIEWAILVGKYPSKFRKYLKFKSHLKKKKLYYYYNKKKLLTPFP